MGYNLKLDIYVFELRKITETVQRRHNGEISLGYKTEKDISLFGDAFKTIYGNNSADEHFVSFLGDFTNSFGNKFKRNQAESQAICVTEGLKKGIAANKFSLWGEFLGGETGLEQEVFHMDNGKEAEKKIGKDQVTSLHYYYKLWLPYDNTKGILMVQGYTDKGHAGFFKTIIEQLFIEKGYKVYWTKFVPRNYINTYLKKSWLYKLQIISVRNKEGASTFSPDFQAFKKAKSTRYIQNFSLPLRKLFGMDNYQSQLKRQITVIDPDFDAQKDELVLYYRNEEGKQARSTLGNIEGILPTFLLDDSLKEVGSQSVDCEKINEYTDELLDKIMIEIGYTPKEL